MVPAFQANGITPKALFDTNNESVPVLGEHDLDLLTTDLDELFGSDIDAVYISSRNDQHAPHAIAAADAEKHILVEKPMALTLAEPAPSSPPRTGPASNSPSTTICPEVRCTHSATTGGRGPNRWLYSARINHAVLLPENLRGWRIATVPGGGVVFDITVHDASVLNPFFAAAPVRVTRSG